MLDKHKVVYVSGGAPEHTIVEVRVLSHVMVAVLRLVAGLDHMKSGRRSGSKPTNIHLTYLSLESRRSEQFRLYWCSGRLQNSMGSIPCFRLDTQVSSVPDVGRQSLTDF